MSTRFLACQVEASPCPIESQVWLSVEQMTVEQLGITPGALLHVIAWGFGVVLLGWLLGYGVSLAVRLIRSV